VNSDVVNQAKASLSRTPRRLDDPDLWRFDGPGLFAIFGDPHVWQELRFGEPPDDRPLYIGQSDKNSLRREVQLHFKTGKTGNSGLRRSLAALLRDKLGLRAQPRNLSKPERFSNFSLHPHGDALLTEWMYDRLLVVPWIRLGREPLDPVETELIQAWQPPLNTHAVRTDWSELVVAARKRMAGEAEAWKPR
jgi:hypothetical protein